jgi:hypothetical protein
MSYSKKGCGKIRFIRTCRQKKELMAFEEIAEKFPREGFGPPLNSRQNAEAVVNKALASFKRNLFAIQYAEKMTKRGVPTTIEEGVQYYYDLLSNGIDVNRMILEG